jgi:predicted O-methyltransferase YrrM
MNLKKRLLKVRYLRHPYLITRAFLRPLEVWNSKQHSLRLNEYEQYSVSLDEAIKALTGYPKPAGTDLVKELYDSSLLRYLHTRLQEAGDVGGPIDHQSGTALYVLVRIFKPEVVVETGVANGVSSSFILKALDQNSRGRLYSIDLHYREGVSVPIGKELGWIVPEELRNRWLLVLGESTKVLPKLLEKLGTVDMFFHDSRHTYKTMMKEYSIVWPFLKDGGLLLSHDVKSNDAFLDFVDSIKTKPIVVGNVGIARKPLCGGKS